MEHKDKESIVKTILRYSSSKIYQQILALFTAFIRPKLLSPELFGLWNILNIIPTYASYSNLGTYDIMRYMIPYHEERKECHKSIEIRDSVFYGSMYLNLFIAVGLIIFSFIGDITLNVRFGLITMACVVIISWHYENYIVLLKAYQNFRLITSTFYLQATITFFLNVICIYFFKIYGAYLAILLSFVIITFYLKTQNPSNSSHTKFKYSIFIELVKRGLPIMIYNFSAILINTSDRIIISSFLGTEQLGYYGIADMVLGFIIQIPVTAREVLEPRMMQDINKNSMERHISDYFLKPTFHTAYLMPLLIGPIFFLLPVVIPLLLPKYVNGILPAQIIVLGSFFVAMSYAARGVIVAYNWQSKALAVMVLGLFINIVFSILLLKIGLGINGVAIGSSISFCVLFISLFVFIRKQSKNSIPGFTKNIIGMSCPFLIMTATIALLQYAGKFIPINIYIAPFLKVFIFYVIMFFVIKYARERYPFLKIFNLGDLKSKLKC
jgi:O-antigen/teichoic acid export membrane protein